jgi:hypothetical protein
MIRRNPKLWTFHSAARAIALAELGIAADVTLSESSRNLNQ